jgi:8-oxo-dGTP pyrophosphatase MutT (NUDIX family)
VSPAVPRDAATVVVVRETSAAAGLEVLLLQRAERGDHNSGAWVFPGGLLDPGDRAGGTMPLGMDDAQASARLGVAQGGLAFYLAAIRECFEESGILFAVDGRGEFVSLAGEAGAQLAALRHEVKEGRCTLAELCSRFSLRLVPERLHYIGHWLTPAGRAKRFDTRFFLAIAPQQQTAMHDASETLDHVWIAAAEALSPSNARRLMTPTRAMLESVAPFADAAALAAWAASPRQVERVLPRLGMTAAGVQPVLPDHPAYEELGKLDPDGRCDAWSELRPGVPVRIGAHVERTTDASGRNAYRVGDDAQGWEELAPGSVRLVESDGILVAPDRAAAPQQLLAAADWLAPERGFLQPLVPRA